MVSPPLPTDHAQRAQISDDHRPLIAPNASLLRSAPKLPRNSRRPAWKCREVPGAGGPARPPLGRDAPRAGLQEGRAICCGPAGHLTAGLLCPESRPQKNAQSPPAGEVADTDIHFLLGRHVYLLPLPPHLPRPLLTVPSPSDPPRRRDASAWQLAKRKSSGQASSACSPHLTAQQHKSIRSGTRRGQVLDGHRCIMGDDHRGGGGKGSADAQGRRPTT